MQMFGNTGPDIDCQANHLEIIAFLQEADK
jgi:hypothetical protein